MTVRAQGFLHEAPTLVRRQRGAFPVDPVQTLAVARRVLRQLRRDHRTLALLFVLPPALLWLVSAVFDQQPLIFQMVGPLMLGLFPFTMMFVVTSIALLRERTQGTLDLMLASPLGRGDLMTGYALAMTLVALIQAAITLTVALGPLGLVNHGSLWLTLVLVLTLALFGLTLGLFLSAFARSEFQAVQFLPMAILPQVFLGGLLTPVERLPRVLEIVARILPLTYAFEALGRVMRQGLDLGDGRVQLDIAVLLVAVVVLLVAGALTLRRMEA